MRIPKKYHFHFVALLAVAAILFFPNFKSRPDQQTLAQGTAAAEAFLTAIDTERYDDAWQSASQLLQQKVVREVWLEQAPAMRNKYGTLLSREQKDARTATWAEGAPDGQYLTLKYDSSFKLRPAVVETVILALSADQQWRVAGYFLK